jgi:outer membrane receptor protein involved in Fe transport
VSLWNKYTFRGGALDGFFIGGGIVHRDESFLSSLPRDINIKTPSFNRLDLMVGYSGTWQGKPFRVEVKVDNVTDELYHLRQDIIAPGTQVLVSFKVDL